MTELKEINDKLVIEDEYSPIVKNFIRGQFKIGNFSESKIKKMVKESFVYEHSSIYIQDLIHHCKS